MCLPLLGCEGDAPIHIPRRSPFGAISPTPAGSETGSIETGADMHSLFNSPIADDQWASAALLSITLGQPS